MIADSCFAVAWLSFSHSDAEFRLNSPLYKFHLPDRIERVVRTDQAHNEKVALSKTKLLKIVLFKEDRVSTYIREISK